MRNWEGYGGPLSELCSRLGIHHPTFAVCISCFGSDLIHSTFMFYYVKVFLNKYHITEGWFQLAQMLFLVWNALNDPLFGYFQDVGSSWMRSRKKSILYGTPFFALSFLLPWFPWADYDVTPAWVVGVHLIVALFFYDGLFSFVLLAWCSVFSEATTDHADRVRAVKYMQLMHLFGYNIILVMEKLSASLQEFAMFQMGTICIAFVGFLCLSYTGKYAPDHVAQVQSFKHLTDTEKQEDSSVWSERLRLTKDVLTSKDFRRVTATNFLHICRSTAQVSFAAIFTEGLVPRSILPLGSWKISGFYGLCAVVPQILVIITAPLVVRHGPYRMMMWSFVSSVTFGLVIFLCGRQFPLLILFFMLIDCINVATFSPLMMVLFSDFIDDDMVRNKRSSPISSVVYSLNALFTKPAQSLAPMLIVYLLNLRGYEHYKNSKDKLVGEPEKLLKLQDQMFLLLTVLPIALAAMELVVFRRYTLTNKHLSDPSTPTNHKSHIGDCI